MHFIAEGVLLFFSAVGIIIAALLICEYLGDFIVWLAKRWPK